MPSPAALLSTAGTFSAELWSQMPIICNPFRFASLTILRGDISKSAQGDKQL
jgi:hypothetical protein